MSIRDARLARYVKERQSLKDLSDKANMILDDTLAERGVRIDPDNVIRMPDLIDLVQKNVINHDQAFLIYNMFHEQRSEVGTHVNTRDKDIYVLLDQVPAVRAIEVIILISLLMAMAI